MRRLRIWRKPDAVEVAAIALLVGIFTFGYLKLSQPYKADAPSSVPRDAPGGEADAYRLGYFDPANGQPVRFNPCEPLRYVVNPKDMPWWALPILHEAVKATASAAEIEMVFAGTTDEIPERTGRGVARAAYDPQRYGVGQWAPIVITWADLSDMPSVKGTTVYGAAGVSAARGRDGKAVLVSGAVFLDPHALTRRSLKLGFMHELLHVLGLDHVDDKRQIMYSGHTYMTAYPSLGAGDLNGLRAVGRHAGCLPPVSPPAPLVSLG